MLFVLERCLPLRASDVAFGSDVHYMSDVSPRGKVGKHHCALALHHYGKAITSLFTNDQNYAIIKPTTRKVENLMNKKKYLTSLAFSFAYALGLGVGYVCFGHLLGCLLVAIYFGESVFSAYPRYTLFCAVVLLLVLITLVVLFFIDLRVSKKLELSRFVRFCKISLSILLSFPAALLWDAIFELLRSLF